MQIRRLGVGDEAFATDAVRSLFDDQERDGRMPSTDHLREFLARDENYLIVAIDQNVPVGFLSAYRMLQLPRDASMVYLYEIEVAPAYRRRGVGTGMIELLKSLCRDTDVKEIWVGTETDNVPAIGLYESTGAKREAGQFLEFAYPM